MRCCEAALVDDARRPEGHEGVPGVRKVGVLLMAKIGGDGLEGAPGPSPLPRGPKYWCMECERWVSYYVERPMAAMTGDSMYVFDPERARVNHQRQHVGQGNVAADMFAGHPDLLALDVELREWYE